MTSTREEKESVTISRLLQVKVDENLTNVPVLLTHMKGELTAAGSKTALLSVSMVDDILIERLSLNDCSDLKGQLHYLILALDRVETELGKSVLLPETRDICNNLQEVLERYIVTAVQCPELFNHPPRSLSRSGECLASLSASGAIPILGIVRICNLVATDAGVEAGEQFSAPLILGCVQRIVTLRSFDIFSEQALNDVNLIALFLKLAKSNYISNLIVKSPLFFPASLPGPMTIPGQPPSGTNKNVFVLQTSTLLGRMLMPSTIDHVLLPPQEIASKSAKHVKFAHLSRTTTHELRASLAQIRAQLGSVMDSILALTQPLIRADENTRISVLKWFACAIKNSSARATMGWQQQMAPHGVNLAEHLVSPQAAGQLGGSFERFRMIMNMQAVRMKGIISSGTAMNLAWTILELCKPIKLQNCGGVDEFFLVSTDPIAQELQAALAAEARLGDADRVKSIQASHQSEGPGAFKSHIFWLAVNAVHALVLPTCKEAETAIQCASVFSRDKKEVPMNDAYGEYFCFEVLLNNPRFMESLAHVINLMLVMVLRCAVGHPSTESLASHPSAPFESLDIRNDSANMSDSMAVLPSCMMEEIVELLDFYRKTSEMTGAGLQQSRDITEMLDPDLFLLFTIWTLGSDKIKNPNIRGKAAHVLKTLVRDPRFSNRIERAPYAVRNIGPACIRVFSAVEKTKQSYYDIRMHVKFELRIPIQQLFELLLNHEDHRAQLRSFVSDFRDDFYKFASQLLNDTTYLLEEGLDTLIAIRKKDGAPTAASSAEDPEEGGTAGLGVDRGVEDEDQTEGGQDMYRRSRHNPVEHCKQYMRMGHQTMSTLHQMCKQTCEVLADDKVVLDQMITSCLDPSLDRLVGPKCLELKSQTSRYDFAQFEFDPKKLLFQIIEMYVYLSRGDRREKVAKVLSEDQRYYRPETLRKAINIARREFLIAPEMLKEFEDFVRFTNEYATKLQSAMDSVEIPDEFLDPIMAEIMVDPVLLPTSHSVMDRKHIMRIILSDDHDPFNRQPLRPADLVPQDDLRRRIHEFCKSHKIELDDESMS
jgi:ubiquitin conjugation factor E4 B